MIQLRSIYKNVKKYYFGKYYTVIDELEVSTPSKFRKRVQIKYMSSRSLPYTEN